jgi:hypothetical protein
LLVRTSSPNQYLALRLRLPQEDELDEHDECRDVQKELDETEKACSKQLEEELGGKPEEEGEGGERREEGQVPGIPERLQQTTLSEPSPGPSDLPKRSPHPAHPEPLWHSF